MIRLDKDLSLKAARMAADSGELDEVARMVRDTAQANASEHFRTGRYSRNFKAVRLRGPGGVVDRVVVNDHPAAATIEFGHLALKDDGTPGEFVEGQYNMVRAVWGL